MQTVELNGRPLAVMGGNREGVEAFAKGDDFRADLLSFVDVDGRPLWDGQGMVSPTVRAPTRDEAAAFERSLTWAAAACEADPNDPADWVVFLIEVRDTTDNPAPS